MSFLSLLFGRKRQTHPAGGVGSTVASPDQLAGLVSQGAQIEALPETEAIKAMLAGPDPLVSTDAGEAREARARLSDTAIRQRVTAVTIGSDAGIEARQAAILDRLAIVHDPNEVVISATGRTARLAIVDRRLMSARFLRNGKDLAVFDFRQDVSADDAAIACVRALAALCAETVDLVIEELPISGVFASVGGFAVRDISFDEDRFRATLQEANQRYGAFESADEEAESLPEDSDTAAAVTQLSAAAALQMLRMTLQDNPGAFDEEEAEFIGAVAAGRSG